MTLIDTGTPCWAPEGEHEYVVKKPGVLSRCVHCDKLDPDKHWTEDSGKTPYRVRCHGGSVPEAPACGFVNLSKDEYGYQMAKPDSVWSCPRCGSTATWDDDWYEGYIT
jgi:hypothetical protein